MGMELLAKYRDIVALVFGGAGLVGLILAYLQIRMIGESNAATAQYTRANFVLEIHKWLRSDADRMRFFYRLDYAREESAFLFDAKNFPNSDDEAHLDALLYIISYVGSLLKKKIIDSADVQWMAFIVRTVQENPEVQKYLRWLQSAEQVPHHSGFIDAIYIYEVLIGKKREGYPNLKRYQDQAIVPDN